MSLFSSFEQQMQNPFLLPNSTSNDQFAATSSLDHLMSHDITNRNSSSIDHSSLTHMDKKRKCKQPNYSAQSKRKVLKSKKQEKMTKEVGEKKNSNQEKKAAEAQLAPTGYIHVRARRGQATDSHSLAERVRREKISERMKLLQALVPGCDKVSGKARMLEYVINYVQSLQNQVELLSMNLAYVNSMIYEFGTDLDSFMVNPDDQDLSNLPSPMPRMLQENSATNSILFPNVLPQPSTSRALWDMEDHRQNNMNQSALNNSLFSFH